jgi:SDR family mycofactocin-dependent oxidoreductase
MTGRMQGKVAFVTGAARGMGRSHAVRLAEEGADIIALDICADIDTVRRFYPGATPADLDETVRLVEATGAGIVAVQADVRDLAAVEAAVSEGVSRFGRLDTVVANAGIFNSARPTHKVAPAAWADIVGVNLTGVWHTCRAATPYLIERGGGSMILISSTGGLKGTPHAGPYSATKHGVVGLMRSIALELGQYRIRVNTVHPTGVATDMIHNRAAFKLFLPDVAEPTLEQAAAAFQSTNALPIPWVEPIDVSHAVLYLASDEARYVTGTELKVDAGYTLK